MLSGVQGSTHLRGSPDTHHQNAVSLAFKGIFPGTPALDPQNKTPRGRKRGSGEAFKQRKQPYRCAFQKPKAGAEARHAGSSKSPRQPRGWARWEGDFRVWPSGARKSRGGRGRPWSPVAKTPLSHNAGAPGSTPGQGTRILQAPTKESACCNREQRSRAAAESRRGLGTDRRQQGGEIGEGEEGGGDTRARGPEGIRLPATPSGTPAGA